MPAKADTEGSFFPNCHFFCDCFEHRTKEHGKNSASPVRDGVEKAGKKRLKEECGERHHNIQRLDSDLLKPV